MAPWDGRRGKMLLTSAKDEPYNEETLHAFAFTVARETTDSNKFWLSVDEEGCRWWMRQPMGDFESVEFVEAGYAATAEGYFLRYWISPEELELGDMTTGNFGSAPSNEEN
ncbi:hypothetical protein M0657_004186 [Pyricularia oryzae]|nr:hypothetical protein M0657_004186 [Pyricularia oryzae]KAI7925620.1 hypothetical protein M9X92_003181 [Pyricularia oryzae]